MRRVAQGFSPTILLAALGLALSARAPTPGSLPPWTRGTLDFHQISTGRGNAAVVVFPDGTTMAVDAGAVGDGQVIAETDPRPNGTRTTGAWIADYLAASGVSHLDYVVLTHFHADHIGGLGDLGARIPIVTVIDRGHEYLRPADDDSTFMAYRAFLQAQG